MADKKITYEIKSFAVLSLSSNSKSYLKLKKYINYLIILLIDFYLFKNNFYI